jgi:O-antigen ligase
VKALSNRGGALGHQTKATLIASGVTFVAAYQLAIRPWLLAPLISTCLAVVLALVPTNIFLGSILLARNLADERADTYLAAGLNAGALIGILALGIAYVRLASLGRIRGLGVALLILLLLGFWFLVGLMNFGETRTLLRELIRASSIIALALVSLNSVRRPVDLQRVADVVIVTALVPAVVAVVQMGTGTYRAYGTIAHPNAAAALFVVGLALSLWAFSQRRERRMYIVAAVLFGIALLGTKSLGGMAQMLVTLLVYPLVARRAGSRGGIVAAILALVLVATFSLSPIGGGRISEVGTTRSYNSIAQGEGDTNSLDWRFGNWIKLLQDWREKPVLGYGAGTTVALVTPRQTIPHSDVIRLLVETGVVGTIAFGLLFAALVIRLYRYSRDSSYAATVLAVLAGVAVHGTVNNISLETTSMYALAVLVGAALAGPRAGPAAPWLHDDGGRPGERQAAHAGQPQLSVPALGDRPSQRG